MDPIRLDPIVADLAAALEERDTGFGLPPAAIETARIRLRAAPPSEKRRLALDLVSWAKKLERLAGMKAAGPRVVAAELALELLGDEAEARDMFKDAGLGKDMANAIGRAEAIRAPRAESKPAAPAAPVKLARGLRKT
jgi:hypothetical protein